jgi:hypothetical protein
MDEKLVKTGCRGHFAADLWAFLAFLNGTSGYGTWNA